MKNYLEKFKDKKIGILGCDVEGLATYNYLKKHGLSAVIFDQADKKSFLDKNPEIKKDKPKTYLGPTYLEYLQEMDIIFKTPGIPILRPEIQTAIKKGVVFTSQTNFFFEASPAPIIGITGTKGKGTTSTLIYEILKSANKNVYLGGNVGVSPIGFLDNLTKDSVVVLELSSFQLQTLKTSPHIAVVLNITQDHLDYHKNINEYRKAKKSIVKYQNKNDYAVINADYSTSKQFSQSTIAQKLFFSKIDPTNGCYVDENDNISLETSEGVVFIAKAKELLLRGRHNLENVTAAIEAAYLAGADIESIRETVRAFRGLEHRLELVGEIAGVRYYDDSFSTTPETAIAAIKSFSEPVVLILGGSSKGSDYTELGKIIGESNVKAIIFIGQTAEEISNKISDRYTGERIFGLKDMAEIVEEAASLAKSGEVVLLSPACASFGLFQNYKDRGDKFKQSIKTLLHK